MLPEHSFIPADKDLLSHHLFPLGDILIHKEKVARNHSCLTFGDGTTLKDVMIRSGYSSRILEMSRVPIPAPVPPPRECVS